MMAIYIRYAVIVVVLTYLGSKTSLHGVIITERLDTLCNLHKRLINGIYTNESLIKDSSFDVIRRPHRFIILFQKRSPVPTESTLYILL